MAETPHPGGCLHLNFQAYVEIARLEDTGRFMADVRVTCSDCGAPFEFVGMEMGLDFNGPMASADLQVARLPIRPPMPFRVSAA